MKKLWSKPQLSELRLQMTEKKPGNKGNNGNNGKHKGHNKNKGLKDFYEDICNPSN